MSTPTFSPYVSPGYGIPEQPRTVPTTPRSSGATATTGSGPGTPTGTGDSGLAFVRQLLDSVFGGALTHFAEQALQRYNSGTPVEQILFDLRQTTEYAARFPGMKELQAAGRPINELAYLDLERSYTQVARQFDLPGGFFDSPDDFGRLIGAEVSPAEYQRRLTDWQAYERDTRDPVAAAEYQRQLADAGLPASEGDFLAAVIDPTRAVSAIERRLAAGQIGTEAVRAGFGQVSVEQGLRLADLGVTQDQAKQGFDTLAGSRELFTALPGEAGAEQFGTDTQLGAVFGTDAAARRRVEAQRRRRQAGFEQGGGVASGRSGLAGLATPA